MPKTDAASGWTFQRTLDHIRSEARSEAEKGRMFAEVMREFFLRHPMYEAQFSDVRHWEDWVAGRDGFPVRRDLGIDLVATLRDGSGFVPIQCKRHAPTTRIVKKDIDSFLAASSREAFRSKTGRIFHLVVMAGGGESDFGVLLLYQATGATEDDGARSARRPGRVPSPRPGP